MDTVTHEAHRLVDLLSDLLTGGDGRWVVVERERLRQLRQHALEAVLGERLAAHGHRAPAVKRAEGSSGSDQTSRAVRYCVLGSITAFDGHHTRVRLGGPKQRLVLGLLLRDVGRVVSDDACVEALWPEQPPEGARHTIQTYVSALRRVLDDPIRRDGNGYVLDADPDTVDACRFEALVAAARTCGDPDGGAALLREALGLWHGEPYADLRDAVALQGEIQRLQQDRLQALEDRIQADVQIGRHGQVTIELQQLTCEHPYRERLHGLRMLALYRSSRQAEALEAYEWARRTLVDDLGIDPSPQLQRLQRQILEQDPTLLLAPQRSVERAPEPVRGSSRRASHRNAVAFQEV